MQIVNKKIYSIGFLTMSLLWYCAHASASWNAGDTLSTTIYFNNDTNQQITQTMAPSLDNFSNYLLHFDPQFTKPNASVEPHQNSVATISYNHAWTWYGMNQYAYNYTGRSSKYGCFITEIRLTDSFVYLEANHQIVIASYRQDPDHLDDYLMCTIDSNAKGDRIVHFKSVQASMDNKPDDTKRYSIDDEDSSLKKITYYTIDKPIPLWTDQDTKQTLVINPNQTEPKLGQ